MITDRNHDYRNCKREQLRLHPARRQSDPDQNRQRQLPPDHGRQWPFLPDHDIQWRFPLNEDRKAGSLQIIRQAANQKRIQHRPSFAENVWIQIRFQTWQHWAVQGGVLFLTMLLILWFYNRQRTDTDSIAFCSVFLVFAANTCLSSLLHLFSSHMAELEKTLYLDLKQMVCIRMLEAGIFDLIVLGLLTGFLSRSPKTSILSCLLYLLVPFLWSEFFYLHMLTHLRAVFSGFRQISVSVLCGIAALFPLFWKDVYLPEYLIIWRILTAAGALLLAAEICRMFEKINTGELANDP